MCRRFWLSAAVIFVGLSAPAFSQEPVVTFDLGTFFGGSGLESPRDIRFDSAGNIVLATATSSPPSEYPNATRIGSLGDWNLLVMKLSPDGSTLLWSTLIGGAGKEYVISYDLDGSDAIFLAGTTGSTDFPITSGAFDTTHNGGTPSFYGPTDAYLLKLAANGSQILWSTFLGGSQNDVGRGGVTVDSQGYPYIYGSTSSNDFLDNPSSGRTPNKVNSYLGGLSDGFVVKMARDGASVIWARFVGGSQDTFDGDGEVVVGAEVDGQGSFVLDAIIRSADTATTAGAFQRNYGGGEADIYVAKLTPDGQGLVWATFLGGSEGDWAGPRVKLDSAGSVYLTALTYSTNFPVVNAAQPTLRGGGSDGVVIKLGATGQPQWATYSGGSGQELDIGGPAVDFDGNVFISGITLSSDFPVTSGAFQSSLRDAQGDSYLRIYSATGQPLYSTYFGGGDRDRSTYIAVDASGNPVIVGETSSADFPTTSGAFGRTYSGGRDGFVVRFDVQPSSPSGACDVDGDGRIFGDELAWIGRAFGACSANPGSQWWGGVDYTGDGCVDGADLAILSAPLVWGRSVPACA